MAIKNGEPFLAAQIESILPQLKSDDELIISDDHSTDRSIELIQKFNDIRIKLFTNSGEGLISNFENSLRKSSGRYIFLADQDDVWEPNKIEMMTRQLHAFDLVVCDCELVDEDLIQSNESFFELNGSRKGFVNNLIRNSYMGCCMAFHRKILDKALPFPKNLLVHDGWIGLVGELYFTKTFIKEKLVRHRKHKDNASFTGTKSKISFSNRINYRIRLILNLLSLYYAR
jgi:glycosyltransferase involved in cell wall biosynthesis